MQKNMIKRSAVALSLGLGLATSALGAHSAMAAGQVYDGWSVAAADDSARGVTADQPSHLYVAPDPHQFTGDHDTTGTTVFCFNKDYQEPAGYDPDLDVTTYSKTLAANGVLSKDASSARLTGDALDAAVTKVIYNGAGNDASGLKAKYGLTDDEFYDVTQYAVWYFSDSLLETTQPDASMNAAMVSVYQDLIGKGSDSLPEAPANDALDIYSSTRVGNWQNLLSTQFVDKDTDQPVTPTAPSTTPSAPSTTPTESTSPSAPVSTTPAQPSSPATSPSSPVSTTPAQPSSPATSPSAPVSTTPAQPSSPATTPSDCGSTTPSAPATSPSGTTSPSAPATTPGDNCSTTPSAPVSTTPAQPSSPVTTPSQPTQPSSPVTTPTKPTQPSKPTQPTKPATKQISFRVQYDVTNLKTTAQVNALAKTFAHGQYVYRADVQWNARTGRVMSAPLWAKGVSTSRIETLSVTVAANATPAQILAAEKQAAAQANHVMVNKAVAGKVGHTVTAAYLIPAGAWDNKTTWKQGPHTNAQILAGSSIR